MAPVRPTPQSGALTAMPDGGMEAPVSTLAVTPAPARTPEPTPGLTPRPVPTPDLASIERLLDELTDALANDASAPHDEGRP